MLIVKPDLLFQKLYQKAHTYPRGHRYINVTHCMLCLYDLKVYTTFICINELTGEKKFGKETIADDDDAMYRKKRLSRV